MKTKQIFILILGFSFFSSFAQTTVGGVSIPSTLQAGNSSLVLNGAGIRVKYFMNLYVGALYLKSKNSNSASIISDNQPMAVKLHIISSMITSEKMESAIREGFDKYENKSLISKEIEDFIKVFKDKINNGDVFNLIYTPEIGVQVYKNNKLVGTIKGLEFKKALFNIWLGTDPADDDLKEDMLGS